MRKTILILTLLAGVSLCSQAFASTQCQLKILRVWADTSGVIWFDFDNSTGVGILPESPGREALLSLAMTAMATGRSVIVRYQADGASCSVSRSDFVGMYMI